MVKETQRCIDVFPKPGTRETHARSENYLTFTKPIHRQIDTVIPLPFSQSAIDSLNAAIPAWAQSQNSTASPIFIADVAASFPKGNTDLRDGVHPNDAGDVVIANVLAPVWESVIKSST